MYRFNIPQKVNILRLTNITVLRALNPKEIRVWNNCHSLSAQGTTHSLKQDCAISGQHLSMNATLILSIFQLHDFENNKERFKKSYPCLKTLD